MQDLCDIQCDNCWQWHPGVETETRRQRNILRRLGWTYIKCNDGTHSDICPNCNKPADEAHDAKRGG